MIVDTRGLRPEHIGRRLRIECAAGNFDEIELLEINVCTEGGVCCGVTYRLLSAGTTGESRRAGEVYWRAFQEIANFQMLGD